MTQTTTPTTVTTTNTKATTTPTTVTTTNTTPTTMTNTMTTATARETAQLERLAKALANYGLRPYTRQSSDHKWNAQRNLEGRSHYVDDATLRCFKARVLYTDAAQGGLLFFLIESVNGRPDHRGKNKRAVVFDIFGDVLTSGHFGEENGWHRTSDAALKQAKEFVASFDAIRHTRDKLKAKCKADIASARQTLAMLRPARKPAAPGR